jgi:hypothetical protein
MPADKTAGLSPSCSGQPVLVTVIFKDGQTQNLEKEKNICSKSCNKTLRLAAGSGFILPCRDKRQLLHPP